MAELNGNPTVGGRWVGVGDCWGEGKKRGGGVRERCTEVYGDADRES